MLPASRCSLKTAGDRTRHPVTRRSVSTHAVNCESFVKIAERTVADLTTMCGIADREASTGDSVGSSRANQRRTAAGLPVDWPAVEAADAPRSSRPHWQGHAGRARPGFRANRVEWGAIVGLFGLELAFVGPEEVALELHRTAVWRWWKMIVARLLVSGGAGPCYRSRLTGGLATRGWRGTRRRETARFTGARRCRTDGRVIVSWAGRACARAHEHHE